MTGTSIEHLPRAPLHRPRGTPRVSRRGAWRAGILIAVHVAILAHVAHWKVAGRTMTPLEPSEAMQTFELGYVNAGFVLLALATAATLVVGRFFCGWLCHVVAYQDLCAWMLGKVGVRPRPLRARLLAWVPIGAALYMFAWPSVSRWIAGESFPAWRAHFSTADLWATFPSPAIAALTIAVDGFLIVYLLGGKAFCAYGCPYGAIFGVADRAALGRIRVSDACNGCGQCTAVCTSNVRVHEEVARHRQVVDPGCMKCMDCVSTCPTSALSFGFGASRAAGLRRSKTRPAKTYDLSWPEEIGALAAFLGALYAFRGAYDAIPFLLAIGLSVIAAVAAVALARLARSTPLRFQHWILRGDDRRVRVAGGVFAATALGYLALGAHTAFVHYHAREGDRWLRAAESASGDPRARAVERASEHLEAAARAGLLPVATWELKRGSLARARGEPALAREHYRRSLELDPELTAPRLALADLAILDGDLAAARTWIVELLELAPSDVQAQRRLAAIENALAASGR